MYESVWLPRLHEDGNIERATTQGTTHGPDQPPLNANQFTPNMLLQMITQGNLPHGLPNPGHVTPNMILQMVAQGNLPHGIPHGVVQQAVQQLHTHTQTPPGTAQPQEPDHDGGQSDGQESETSNQDDDIVRNGKQERLRIRANWDPSYLNEQVSWYDEYIHRQAPTVVNWFEPARRKDANDRWINVEARGVALYRPGNYTIDSDASHTVLAISPLDDGGICIWDANGTRGKKGSIFAQSKPGLLFVDGPQGDNNRASKRVDSGVTECVSVDNQRHRAFFAVQSRKLPRLPVAHFHLLIVARSH